MLGYESFPPAFRRYLIAVSLLGPFVAVAIGVTFWADWSARQVLLAGLLTAFGVLSERYSLQLTHHIRISVNTAIYVAMLLMLPWSVTGVLAMVSIATAEALRQHGRRTFDLPELLFNA